jgi:hypothetical protein
MRLGFSFSTVWCALALLSANPQTIVAADTVDLIAAPTAGEAIHVDVVLEAAGELKFKEQESLKTVPTAVSARMAYDEIVAPKSDDGRTVRLYSTAEANIQVDKTPSKSILRQDRNLVVIQPTEAQPLVFSAVGPLTAEELDLLQVPFTSTIVDRLLPGKSTTVGDTWKHDDTLLSALLNLDAVSQSDVTSTLSEVDEKAARIELRGTAQGALGGVATEFEIEGRYKFDRATKRVTWVAVLLKEQRSIGHIEPGVNATSRLQMVVAPTKTPADLTAGGLADFDLDTKPEYVQLEYTSTLGRFGLRHDRRWHVMADAREVLSLRMVDRGELVAQCNVRSVPLADANRRPTLAQFQADVRRSIDKHFRQFARVGESQNSLGHTIFRAEAVGDVQELEIHWIYYLVQDQAGHQAVFAFTCEQPMLERLGNADQELISTVRFADDTTTAAQPTPAPTVR